MPLNSSEIEILKHFGENIRKIRVAKNLSMQALANIAEVELSQIYRIEKGKINAKLTTIITICEALEVTPEQLIILEQ